MSSVRDIVLGAPLKVILKHLASKTVAPNLDSFLALVHRPKESYFVLPQVEVPFSQFSYFFFFLKKEEKGPLK